MKNIPLARRGFLGRAAAALSGMSLFPMAAHADPLTSSISAPSAPDESWLTGMKGVHKQMFDMPAIAGGRAMAHVRNYLDTYQKAYGLGDDKINAVIMAYSSALPVMFDDILWEKYQLGTPAKNPYATQLASLRARGVILLGCNNTLNRFANEHAAEKNMTVDEVRTEVTAHLLPGVIIVPGAVIAINRAQESGVSMFYCG